MQEQPQPLPSNLFKVLRVRMGLSQAKMAKILGMTQGNVGHYENKGQTIPPDVAKRLIYEASVLGHRVTYEDIYGEVQRAEDKA